MVPLPIVWPRVFIWKRIHILARLKSFVRFWRKFELSVCLVVIPFYWIMRLSLPRRCWSKFKLPRDIKVLFSLLAVYYAFFYCYCYEQNKWGALKIPKAILNWLLSKQVWRNKRNYNNHRQNTTGSKRDRIILHEIIRDFGLLIKVLITGSRIKLNTKSSSQTNTEQIYKSVVISSLTFIIAAWLPQR